MEKKEELFDLILTKQEAEELISYLAGSAGLRQELEKKYGERIKDISKQHVLEDLRKRLLAVTSVGLTIAFEPDEAFLSKVAKWFSLNMGEKVLIDLDVDSHAVAGAKIICRDHFLDLSASGRVDAKAEATVPAVSLAFLPSVSPH